MKYNPIPLLGALLIVFFCNYTQAQSFGTFASAVWITDCNQSNFFNTSGSAANLIGPAANIFESANLGVHSQNSGTLILRGAQVRTFKDPASSNVCNVRMYYRIYPQSGVGGAFTSMDLSLPEDCNVAGSTFPSGGPCAAGDQKWQRVVPDGVTTPYAPVNLTGYTPGNYVLEVYYDASGSFTTTTQCNDLVTLNNGGNNYKAFFSIQSPNLSSTNPSSCFGNEGSITIGGLVAGASYQLSYEDDGAAVSAAAYVANGAGQVIISGLNAGFYTNFSLLINGCTTNLFTGIILSDPIFVPRFSAIAPFCAGTTAPVLPATSNNGITGTWSPAIVDNQTTGTYRFTPNSGQCGTAVNVTINVIPRTTPNFSFGTALTICTNGVVPALPATSVNGIPGSWNPSVVDNQNSGTYTFTPAAGQCATTTTFTVTISPNITPSFSFGTTTTICAGATVPSLPGTSTNGITGTWAPSIIDNQNSATYTFTPDAGLCATSTSFAVTVDPVITPTFSFGTTLSVCTGGAVPTLATTSTNGITGTWSPAAVDNQNSGTYTFTPAPGICATTTTYTVTVDQNITPTFSFGTATTICAGAAVPALLTTSTNGITGTWNPAVVDNQNPGTYTFTPDAGQCATTTTFTVTVNPNITPTFSFGTSSTMCAGATTPALSTTSTNGITGTWSPSTIDNQNSATYTFTPDAGLCATTTTFTVTVNPNITPTFSFGTTSTICAGDAVPTLSTTSANGISGTWSPAIIDNQNSGTYTFTPTAGLCATSTTFTLTVNPNIVPTFSFGTGLSICAGGTVPTLATTSLNGITGTWSPAVIDNQNSATYTFTPDAGICATALAYSVTVNPNVTPAFSFGTTATVCVGATAPALPLTSSNGITGTWSPSVVDNQNSGTYTFTPNAGECATTTTFTVTVSSNITPTFSFGTSSTICAGATAPVLSTTSLNGITGTWSPSVVDNFSSGSYTFTPAAEFCATTTVLDVTVNPNITPTFSFGTSLSICEGEAVPILGSTSTNGLTGTWSPSVIDNQNSGTYTFTPDAGLCAVNLTLTVTVSPNLTPTFSFGTALTICEGASVPSLPTSSTNGVNGTWSPAVIDSENSATYTFTPNGGQCVTPATITLTVTVTPNVTPVFSFNNSLTFCAGASVPSLPTTSDNGISGTWSPSVVSDQASGTYVFTAAAGQCVTPYTLTVTINPNVTPLFSFGTFQSVCIGTAEPVLPTVSDNGITGTWNPSVVDNKVDRTYTFTPDAGQCALSTTLTYEVNEIPSVTLLTDVTVTDGTVMPVYIFNATPGALITWTNSNPSIGLPASGTGNLPSFTAVNRGNDPITANITVTPAINGCSGTVQRYTITVLPLNKDIFVPNVFTPNRDGKNDMLFVYGNYIDKMEMRIFNQWGQHITTLNSRTQGWDGTHKGKPQPVGVYVYVLRAVLSDGRTVDQKGSITLVR
jgi:gliding motility-associated-like protein